MRTVSAMACSATRDVGLPGGWRWARLGDLSQIVSGQSPSGDTYKKEPQGLPFFQGKADFGEVYPTARTWCTAPRTVALPGDILISVRAPVGPTNIADLKCCIGRGLAAIRCRSEADPRFVFTALRLYEREIARLGSGSTFGAIGRSDLESFPLPVPSLPEQKRIVSILNEQMAAVERARSAVLAQLAAAKALPAAHLRAIFDSPEAQQWPQKRLADVCRLVNGKAYNDSHWSSRGTPIIRIQNLNDPSKPFNYWNGELDGHVAVRDGDVLLGWSGTPRTSFGAHVWDRGPGVLNQHIFRVDLERHAACPGWTVAAINYRIQALIDKAHGGVGLRHVKKREVETLTIRVPALSQQKRIVALLQYQIASYHRLRKGLEAQLETIKRLPTAILRRAFRGEL